VDLLYLVRSGLGIPDYWHPYLEVQKDFLSGTIGRYPISMDSKADYPGQLDEDGIPVVRWGEKKEVKPSPANIILYGLGSHDVFIRTRAEQYHQQFVHVLHWLERNQTPLGEGVGWLHDVDMPVYGLKAPWFSGMVQGIALSLLVRACHVEGPERWALLTQQTWKSYHVSVEDGGFCRTVENGVIYEEYPGPELDCVFNGMCCALIGLWEVWHSGLIKNAEKDFQNGLRGLRHYLPNFDYEAWSLYSLNRCLGKSLLASPYYVRTNAVLAQVIGLIANDSEFYRYGERWLKLHKSIVKRLGMSLRIGFDRFSRAPSILQFDKAR